MEQPQVHRHMSVSDLETHVMQPNNWDGLATYKQMLALANREKVERLQKNFLPLCVAGVAFSAYNVSRFGVLTGSGRIAALYGLTVFSWQTYKCITIKH